MKSRVLLLSVIAGVAFLATSCYSDYVFLHISPRHEATYAVDSQYLYFVAAVQAYKKPKGLSAWPDGGTPRYLLNQESLYCLDVAENTLIKLAGFDDVTSVLYGRWSLSIAVFEETVYYQVTPTTDWEYYLNWAKSSRDSFRVMSLKEKYHGVLGVSFSDSARLKLDTFPVGADYFAISPKDLQVILDSLKVVQWGINLKQLSPKRDNAYVHDLITQTKGGSPLTRRAIVEQIVAPMSRKEKRDILEAFELYKSELPVAEQKLYEMQTREAYEIIKSML